MVDASSRPYVTFADYLEAEQSSDVKHEWFNGSVYAMSRGTPDHARLSASVIMLLGSALPRGCVIYTSDLMLYVEAVKLSTYADASVVSGPLETITVKRNGRSLGEGATNPVVIVEVLSDSTERYDREEKFSYYRTLPSLREFVLVSQAEVSVEVFRRPAAGQGRGSSHPFPDPVGGWTRERAGAGGAVTIHGCAIEVDAIYDTRA